MAMEESERSRLRNLQREQERERRRIRDRQRRESMSHEQRERHLARRRRNYQLRRQRAANAAMDSQSDQRAIMDSDDKISGDENQAVTSSQLIVQCNGIAPVGFDQGQDKLDLECINLEGFDALAQGSASFPRRIRLNHVKHLARSLHHRVGEPTGDRCQIVADSLLLGDTPNNCKPSKELRLTHVKRLARKLKLSLTMTVDQIHLTEEQVEQNLPQEESPLLSTDVAKYVQSYDEDDTGKGVQS